MADQNFKTAKVMTYDNFSAMYESSLGIGGADIIGADIGIEEVDSRDHDHYRSTS